MTISPELTIPTDDGWDEARRAWNLAVDQHPTAVTHATRPEDVAAAVSYARERGLRVTVQATGHAASAMGPLDDTLLVRTNRMGGARIDADDRVARVEAGALWGDVVERAGEHGLVALHGSSIDTGAVGYTLGGGIGWLARLHGLACNHVRAIELVTADGELGRVDHEHEPDLFWALRGGGGSFGIVTAMELELFELREVYAGVLFWPAEAGGEVLHAYREWARGVPEEVTSIIRYLRLPPLPEVPEQLRDRPVIDLGLAFTGGAAEGEELVRPLREASPPMIDTFGTMPAPDLRRLHGDPEQPVPGLTHHTLVRELTPEAADAFIGVAGPDSGSPLTGVELRQLGGALARREPGQGALATLDGEYALGAVGSLMDPARGPAIQAHLDAVVEAMAPWASERTYSNFEGRPDSDPATAFDADTYARLRAVKAQVDPDDLFAANLTIAPAG